MIVVNFEREMREAFAAGEAAASARRLASLKNVPSDYAEHFAAVPKTYEEWRESIRDRPAVVRG